ncbi:MAG: hypothetical protein AAF990_14315 [Bacteroidota bacterium]
MKITKIFLLHFLFVMGFVVQGNAQEVAARQYQKVVEAFTAKEQLSCVVEIMLYDQLEGGEASSEMKINYCKKGEEMYARFDLFEVLKNERHYLYVDHSQKQVNQLPLVPGEQIFPSFDFAQLEQLIEWLELEGTLFETSGGHKGIRFTAAKKSKTVIELIYEPESGHILQSSMALDLAPYDAVDHDLDGKRVVSNFTQLQSGSVQLPRRVRDVLQASGQQLKSSGQYASYQLNPLQAARSGR